jgi:murein DD-endopeptidase MepM/ murein hydrolase activator NlpD
VFFFRPTPATTKFLISQSNSPSLDASIFSPPLGFQNGFKYIPKYTYDTQGYLIENTDYGIQNPDLKYFSNCFSLERRYLLHAGEDLYRIDGSSAAGDEVTAVADGIVFNYDASWDYPGEAVVLQHHLTTGEYVYSIYMHIIDIPPEITTGQSVVRGQRIGTILQQNYDGNYPNYHGADDSHLHFEMRYFASAANIYYDHPNCNIGDAAGRGYTYPSYPPDTYPNSSQHYTDPGTFIRSRAGTYLPLIQRANCINGQQLLANRGFESGGSSWMEESQPDYPVITNYKLPTSAHSGTWAAWFGGRNNASERIYQSFAVLPGTTRVYLSYYFG